MSKLVLQFPRRLLAVLASVTTLLSLPHADALWEHCERPGCLRVVSGDLSLNALNVSNPQSISSLELLVPLTDDQCAQVSHFTNLQELGIGQGNLKGSGLQQLDGLQRLKHFYMSFCQVPESLIMKFFFAHPSLEEVNLSDQKLEPDGIRKLALALPNLRKLSLRARNIGDEELAAIGSLSSLESLNLDRLFGATSAGVEHLAGLQRLKELRLSADSSFVPQIITALPNLTSLHLAGDEGPTDGQFKGICKLKGLRSLSINAGRLTDSCVTDLSRLSRLQELGLFNLKTGNNIVAHSENLRNLRRLSISGNVDEDALMRLAKLKDLRSLYLLEVHPPIADGALKKWSTLTKLNYLNLGGSNVDDMGLSVLANFRELEQFDCFQCSQITDEGLKHLSGLKHLKNLDLWGSQVNGSGSVYLKNCPDFRTFRFNKELATDAFLANHQFLKTQKKLDLSKSKVTDVGLRNLRDLPVLEDLILANTEITDQGLSELSALPCLRSIDVSGTLITDDGLQHLKNFRTLHVVRSSSNKVEGWSISALSELPALTELHLNGTKFSDKYAKLLAGMAGLELLDLSETDTGDESLGYIAKMTRLRSLNLQQTKITQAALWSMQSLNSLETLNLSNNPKLLENGPESQLSAPVRENPASGLSSLKSLPKLRELYVVNTGIGDVLMPSLSEMRGLTKLIVYDNPISMDSLFALRRRLPDCDITVARRGGCGFPITKFIKISPQGKSGK